MNKEREEETKKERKKEERERERAFVNMEGMRKRSFIAMSVDGSDLPDQASSQGSSSNVTTTKVAIENPKGLSYIVSFRLFSPLLFARLSLSFTSLPFLSTSLLCFSRTHTNSPSPSLSNSLSLSFAYTGGLLSRHQRLYGCWISYLPLCVWSVWCRSRSFRHGSSHCCCLHLLSLCG